MIAYKIRESLKDLVETQKIKTVLVIGEGRSCKATLASIAQQLKGYGFKNVDHKTPTVLDINQDVVEAYKLLNKSNDSVLGWRILGNPSEDDQKEHLKRAKTLDTLLNGIPSKIAKLKPENILELESVIEGIEADEATPEKMCEQNQKIRSSLLVDQLRKESSHLQRPLKNIDITVCNILNSKGLGADVVFLIGFDQGRFPVKEDPRDDEVYQMLVAITRAKKRLYLVNTAKRDVSSFIGAIAEDDLKKTPIRV